MMVQMLGVFAEFERATIIDRVVAGMERKAARGGWNGGSVPFGYRFNRENGVLDIEPNEAALVPVIFDLYLNKRLGTRSIGTWLAQRGHRTRGGKPWNFKAVLTVLRNRVYLGEVCFRGSWHPAPQPALIDAATFEATQALLEERGESHSRRATNSSEYVLAGLVVCAACGKHFVGTAAHDKRARYTYYTCFFSRHRYGTPFCSAERLPAERLDDAVLQSPFDTYGDDRLIARAVAYAQARVKAAQPRHAEELAAVQAEIRRPLRPSIATSKPSSQERCRTLPARPGSRPWPRSCGVSRCARASCRRPSMMKNRCKPRPRLSWPN
jgi:site-specific DNA recombinase